MDAPVNLSVRDREELFYLLAEAAEFEHAVMCTYLYAQWSLKRDEREGVTREELEAIERWRKEILGVAVEEMLHLALVNNIMAALGAAPHFQRPDFPIAKGYFPADLDIHLAPFNEATIEHFVFIERPEGIDIEDGTGFTHEKHYQRVVCTDLLSPTPRDYESQGHLYHGIAQAIKNLAEKLGEERLFVGHGEAQMTSSEFPLPGLFAVHDVESAHKALEEIVSQGEGAPAHREDSHFARFSAIRDEYLALKKKRADFEPAFPAAVNPVLTEFAAGESVTRVNKHLARGVVDLGNSIYGLMVQTLAQICAPVPLPSGLREGLSDISCGLMRHCGVVGEAAVRLPICDKHPGVTAGLSFAIPRSFGQLVQANAAQIIAERAAELAQVCRSLEADVKLPGVADGLEQAAADLEEMHRRFEENFTLSAGKGADFTPVAADPAHPDKDKTDEVFPDSDDDNVASTDQLTLRFNTERCIHSRFCVLNAPRVFLANVEGPWLHPEEARVEHLAHVAQSCPSGAITYERRDGEPGEQPPEVNTLKLRQNGPYVLHASLEIEDQNPMHRATLCRCGKSKNKPFCDNSHVEAGFEATGEPDTVTSEPLDPRGGSLRVRPVKDGPLKVRGPLELCAASGRTINRAGYVKLCRCGGSSNKPYCDDTHLKIGFKSDQ